MAALNRIVGCWFFFQSFTLALRAWMRTVAVDPILFVGDVGLRTQGDL
jgi:hypothetical protein